MASERDRIERLDAELRQVAETADALVRVARDLRASLDSLADELREAAREPAAAAEPAAGEPVVMEPPVAVEPATADDGEIPEGARLVALDMVLDGRSRDEVAERLRAEFGLADPAELLDDVRRRIDG